MKTGYAVAMAEAVSSQFQRLGVLTDRVRLQTKQGEFGRTSMDGPALLENAEELASCIKGVRTDDQKLLLMQEDTVQGITNKSQYLRACYWAAEVFVYFGRRLPALELIEEDARSILASLPDSAPPETLLQLFRQKIWIVLHYAYCGLYLPHDNEAALRVVDSCDRFVTTLLQRKEFPCFYTRARIASQQAAILRQLGQLVEAQQRYEKALSLIYDRLEFRRGAPELGPRDLHRDTIRSSYEAAKILALGIGWTQSTRGLLDEARANVITALVMLAPTGDVLRTTYAKLILASIERAKAGFDGAKLDAALLLLEEYRQVFCRYGHRRYESRCRYEQALAYLYRGRVEEDKGGIEVAQPLYSEAEGHMLAVLEFSIEERDKRWECIAYTGLSRIRRYGRDVLNAQGYADKAIALSSHGRADSQVVVDALIAQGEANFLAGEAPEAARNYEAARSICRHNPKSFGICNLRLAEAYLKTQNLRMALEHFHVWTSIKDKVAHGVIRDIAERVKTEIEAKQNAWYVVRADQIQTYKQHDKDLREYLIARASSRHTGIDGIISELGIKRATYYSWLKELRPKNKRPESNP